MSGTFFSLKISSMEMLTPHPWSHGRGTRVMVVPLLLVLMMTELGDVDAAEASILAKVPLKPFQWEWIMLAITAMHSALPSGYKSDFLREW